MTDMQAALRRIGLGVLALVLILAQQALAQEGDDDQSGEGESPPSKLAEYYGFGPMEVLKIEQDLSIPIIADINGDGLNDIVVVNNRKARIDILLQRKDFTPSQEGPAEVDDEDVNDIFGREKTWRFKRCSYDLDVAASSPVVADLNGDKLPDMAFYAKDGLRVVLQSARKPASSPAASLPTAGGQGARKPAGKGPQTASQPQTTRPEGPPEPTWLPAVKIDISENAAGDRSLAAGDLNGDKRTDLALLAGEAVYTVLQKEDGAMAKPVKHYCGGARPRQIDIADVNGDGRADLVVLTGEEDYPVSVRYQTAQGALQSPAT